MSGNRCETVLCPLNSPITHADQNFTLLPRISFCFFLVLYYWLGHKMVWKHLNELIGQPNDNSPNPIVKKAYLLLSSGSQPGRFCSLGPLGNVWHCFCYWHRPGMLKLHVHRNSLHRKELLLVPKGLQCRGEKTCLRGQQHSARTVQLWPKV